jgi:RNA polymerase sigma-70 factor (ECF subfamily)
MRSDAEISDLITRISAGDEGAVRDFLLEFEDELRIMVRGQLPRKLRIYFDSTDFVQAVWQSFFSDLEGEPKEFENARHLRGFLAGIVRNKIFEQHRRLTRTAKYTIAKEERLYVRRDGREVGREFVSPEPTPSQEVQASDRLAQLIAGFSPLEVQVITLRHQGLTCTEIAERTGLGERSVRRVIEKARQRMDARP